MGLESVELIMDVEDAFGIQIADEEASKIVTVGELYETILGKLKQARSEECMTAKMFYRLRRGLSALTGASRRAVRPDTLLEALVPSSRRREFWRHLGQLLKMDLPSLQRPRWVANSMAAVILGLIAVTILAASIPSTLSPILPGVAAVGLILTAGRLTRPWATHLKPGQTIGGLTKILLQDNFGVLAAETGHVNEKEVWDSLVAAMATSLRVPKEELRPDIRIIQDLGLGG